MYINIKLKDILKNKGISNRSFATMTGISRNVINNYCNNEPDQHIPLANLAKMCQFLHCGITDILELVHEERDPFIFTFPDEEQEEQLGLTHVEIGKSESIIKEQQKNDH